MRRVRGETVHINAECEHFDTLVDCDEGFPKLYLYDSLGFTRLNGVLMEPLATGKYSYLYQIAVLPADAPLGDWHGEIYLQYTVLDKTLTEVLSFDWNVVPKPDLAYATASEYRAVIGKSDDASDEDIHRDLLAISRYIDGKCSRTFKRDIEAGAKYFIAPATADVIRLPDMAATPTTLKVDDDCDGVCETAITGFEMWPLNAPSEAEPRPYTRIHLPSWASKQLFLEGQKVEVTGIWGWPAVPLGIRTATMHLTAILRLETPRATRRIPELGDAIEASADAQNIIRQLTDQYQIVRYV